MRPHYWSLLRRARSRPSCAPVSPSECGCPCNRALTVPSQIYRQATLSALYALSEEVDALSDAVRAIPDDDAVADQFIARMLTVQNTAGAFLERFRNSRDAQGQA